MIRAKTCLHNDLRLNVRPPLITVDMVFIPAVTENHYTEIASVIQPRSRDLKQPSLPQLASIF